MRPSIVAHVFLMLALISLGPTGKVVGGENDETHKLMQEILDKGAKVISVMEKNDLEISKIDIDLVGLIESKDVLKTLDFHYKYVISVVGQPSRIDILDIEIYHITAAGNARLVTRTESIDACPTITLDMTNREPGQYKIVIVAKVMALGFEKALGYYFLAIAHN